MRVDVLLADVREDRLERLAVGVQVGDDRDPHARCASAARPDRRPARPAPRSTTRSRAASRAPSMRRARGAAVAAAAEAPRPARRRRSSPLLRAESLTLPCAGSRRNSTTSTPRHAPQDVEHLVPVGRPASRRPAAVRDQDAPGGRRRGTRSPASSAASSSGCSRAPALEMARAERAPARRPRATSSAAARRVSASVFGVAEPARVGDQRGEHARRPRRGRARTPSARARR